MSNENLDKATQYIRMRGGPMDPPPGDWYGCVRLLAMALDEIVTHLKEQS
jgi:hypothetical protein